MWFREENLAKTENLSYLSDEQIKRSVAMIEEKRGWDQPFPMGVFGTLRQNCGNNYLMHRAPILGYARAFLSHFMAHSLTVSYAPESTCPFEIFFYDADGWKTMIPSVDRLEGFHPPQEKEYNESYYGYGYHRTLAWLHVLPKDYTHELFTNQTLGRERNLRIKMADWKNYQKIPCWVYANMRSNKAVAENKKESNPVIWC